MEEFLDIQRAEKVLSVVALAFTGGTYRTKHRE